MIGYILLFIYQSIFVKVCRDSINHSVKHSLTNSRENDHLYRQADGVEVEITLWDKMVVKVMKKLIKHVKWGSRQA